MPIGRLENTAPAAKLRNTDFPTARIKESPHASITMQGAISIGNPIGLLLALTYAVAYAGTSVSTPRAEKMFVKIRNTD